MKELLSTPIVSFAVMFVVCSFYYCVVDLLDIDYSSISINFPLYFPCACLVNTLTARSQASKQVSVLYFSYYFLCSCFGNEPSGDCLYLINTGLFRA